MSSIDIEPGKNIIMVHDIKPSLIFLLSSVLAKLLSNLNENDDKDINFLRNYLSSRGLTALLNLHQKVQVTSK